MGKNRSRSTNSAASTAAKAKAPRPNTQFKRLRSKTWEKKKVPVEPPSKAQIAAALLENVGKYESDLNLFLSKIHQTPMHFKEEMVQKIAEFNTSFTEFKENSQKRDEKFARLTVFLANVVEYYRKDLAFLVPTISDALSSYANVMHPFVRMKCVQCLTIIAKKGLFS